MAHTLENSRGAYAALSDDEFFVADEPTRLYIDPDNDVYCLLDDEDYAWACKWRWGTVVNSTGKKLYVSRSTRLHGANGPQTRVYLHKEILKHMGVKQKTKLHIVGDHIDGDSLNNQRSNLRWANRAMNAQNNPKRRRSKE